MIDDSEDNGSLHSSELTASELILGVIRESIPTMNTYDKSTFQKI